MARLVSPAPTATPMYVAGSMTVPWQAWFQSVFGLGDIIQNVIIQQIVAEDNSTDGTANEFVQSVMDVIWQLQPTPSPLSVISPDDIVTDAVNESVQPARNWQPQIDELGTAAYLQPLGRDWSNEIDDLQAQVNAAAQPAPVNPVQAQAPATATDYGEPGMLAYDGGFIYVCTAPNTWVRAALTTF